MSELDSRTAATPLVSLRNIRKTYWRGKEAVRVLDGLSLDIPARAFEALMGPSGSGKSTLLKLLGCLDRPSSGRYFLGGDDVATMTDSQLSFSISGNTNPNAGVSISGDRFIDVNPADDFAGSSIVTCFQSSGWSCRLRNFSPSISAWPRTSTTPRASSIEAT